MNRAFPAALALACVCVCTPAMAAPVADLSHAFASGLFVQVAGSAALALLLCLVRRLLLLGLVAGACLVLVAVVLGFSPVMADTATTVGAIAGATVVSPIATAPGIVVPYGQWLVDYGPPIAILLGTWLAAIVSWALAKWAPWATSVLTQQRVEQAAIALAQYGVKAVASSTKDGKVTVNAGPAVIQAAVQRGVNVLPGKVVKAMEKGGGMASIIFRVLDLEETADEHKVLQPAIAALKRSADPKVAKAA